MAPPGPGVVVLGIYLFSMVVGVGLILFTVFTGGEGDSSDLDLELDAGGDLELEGEVEFDADGFDGGGLGEVVLGLFKPRNLTFLLAAFGTTGSLLTWTGTNPATTLTLAATMGGGAWVLTHGLFTWLKRTDSGIDALDDHDLEGSIATVSLPIEPGARGRIMIVAAGRQAWLTARLEPGIERTLAPGTEVLIRRTADGVAEVIPTDTLDLPPKTS